MNKVFLIGNLTRDPELSATPSGVSVCKFTIAVNRNYSGADGERQVDFLPIVAWRKQADNCGRYLRKGSKVAIAGNIQTRSYDAVDFLPIQDGTKRYITEIMADDVQFLSERERESADAPRSATSINSLKPIEDGDLPF